MSPYRDKCADTSRTGPPATKADKGMVMVPEERAHEFPPDDDGPSYSLRRR